MSKTNDTLISEKRARSAKSYVIIIIIIIIIKAYTALIQTVLSALQFINSIKYNKNINIQINIQSYGLNKKKKKQTNKQTN